jgi:hypothetical protein
MIRKENAMIRKALLLFAALAALAGCATNPAQRDADKLALYTAHAGAPVDSFRYYGSINGWTPLGDEAIALWSRPSEAWLLDLSGPCQDLDYARAITVTNTFGRVSARFDKVLVLGRSAIDIPCVIRQIRPLNVKAIRQAERDARATTQASGT